MACMPRTKTSMGLVVTILETNKDRDYDADAESTGWLTGHHAQPGHHHIIALLVAASGAHALTQILQL